MGNTLPLTAPVHIAYPVDWDDGSGDLIVATLPGHNPNLGDLLKTMSEIGEVSVTFGLREGSPAIRLETTRLNTEVSRLTFLLGLYGLFPDIDLSRILYTDEAPTSVWVGKPRVRA